MTSSFTAAGLALTLATGLNVDAALAGNKQAYGQLHNSVKNDIGIYARDLFLAYVKSPDPQINRITQHGLLKLAAEAQLRTAINPVGVVGIDLEKDDITNFPFIYWPVTEQTPLLSAQAAEKVRIHAERFGKFFIDVSDSTTLRNNTRLPALVNSLGVKPLEVIEEGNLLTETMYLTADLPGAARKETLIERAPEGQGYNSVSFIIGNQKWASAWSGGSVGSDVHENAIRAGINMLAYTTMGDYKLDEYHRATIEQKRLFQQEHRLRQETEGQTQETAPENTSPLP